MDQSPMPRPAHRKPQPVSTDQLQKVVKDVNNLAASLRIMEERYTLMRGKSQLSEQNLIEMEQGVTKDIKLLSDEITELKHQLREITNTMRMVSSELANMVSKDEFRVIERYIEMWEPMSFVTRNELSKMVAERKTNQ